MLPFVCANKGECSPEKITPDFHEEEKDGEPEENPSTESVIELEEKTPDESEDTEVTILMEEYAAAASDVVTTESSVLSDWEEIQTTSQTLPAINWQHQHHQDEDEASTESPEMEMTTEVVEEYQAEIPAMKELGEELLPYEGVVYYPEEIEVEQTTDAIFIPNGDKELLEVLPTTEQNTSDSNFQSTFSLETTTEMSENHNNYQQEETTVLPKLLEKENTKMKSKSIFPFVTASYSIIRPIATYGLDLLSK